MKLLVRRKTIRVLILLLIAGILGIATWFLFTGKEASDLLTPSDAPSRIAYGKGISFVEYHGDKKIYAVSIESFSVERARLGPFAIGPLNVAHLNKVVVDLYIYGIEPRSEKAIGAGQVSGPGMLNLENPLSGIKRNLPFKSGKIRGIRVKDVSVNAWKEEKRIFSISSDTATVDRDTGDLIFAGHAIMDGGDRGRLISHRIRWNRKTHLFSTRDSYILTRGAEKQQGIGIETDYRFTGVNRETSAR